MDNSITLSKLIDICIKNIKQILLISLFFQFFIALFIISQPNDFQGKVILKIDSDTVDSFDANDLISISGLDISSQDNFISEVYEISKSLDFFEYFVKKRSFEVELIAAIPSIDNTWRVDENKFNSETNEWNRTVSSPLTVIPSTQELHKVFFEDYARIDVDPKTNFLVIRINHFSPELIFKWLKNFSEDLIDYTRKKEQEKSNKLLEFYFEEMESNSKKYISGISLPSVIKDKIMNQIFADALPNYRFSYIQKPYKPQFNENSKILSFLLFSALIYVLVSGIIIYLSLNKIKLNRFIVNG